MMSAGIQHMIQLPQKQLIRTAFAAVVPDAPPQVAKVTSPWTTLPGGVIDGGEIVMLAIKPSLWRPVFDSAAWLVTSVLLAVTLLWTGKTIPGFSLATTAQLVLLVGIARLGWAAVHWVPTWHVLTNRRIIDVFGVRTPHIESCELLNIRNTYLNPSSTESLARLGTIIFVTDHADAPPRAWRTIAKPDLVHAKIRRAIESAIDNHGLGV